MSINACAELVRKGDPDRFQATMTAASELRGRLFVLYAFNLEIARAAWSSQEPMIAEMRLQFWVDILDSIAKGQGVASHEVAGPLSDVINDHHLPIGLFEDMINARRLDVYNTPFADLDSFQAYVKSTSGNLMQLAVLSLQGNEKAAEIGRIFGYGTGVAAMFLAFPKLQAASQACLPPHDETDGHHAGVIGALADEGLQALAAARAQKSQVPAQCAAAFRIGWMAKPLLLQAKRHPEHVVKGHLGVSDFSRKSRLLAMAIIGNW